MPTFLVSSRTFCSSSKSRKPRPCSLPETIYSVFTLSYLLGEHECPAMRPIQLWLNMQPRCNLAYINLLKPLANCRRLIRYLSKTDFPTIMAEQHLPKKCKMVSSSSIHAGHEGSVHTTITVKCLLSATSPIRRPAMIINLRFLSPR